MLRLNNNKNVCLDVNDFNRRYNFNINVASDFFLFYHLCDDITHLFCIDIIVFFFGKT